MKSDQYAEKIEQTREDIDKTLMTLENKLSPRELLDQALRWSGGDLHFRLGRVLRDNPIPTALLGISLLWLVVAGSRENGSLSEREHLNRHMQEVDSRLYI